MLKTLCNNCTFLLEDKCIFDKTILQKEKIYYALGLCRHKRNQEWLDKDSNYTPSYRIGVEESKITVIIIATDNDAAKTNFTLNYLDNPLIDEVIILTKNTTKEYCDSIQEQLKKTNKWQIDNLQISDDEFVFKPDILIDYSSRLISNHWFIPLINGDMIDNRLVDQFYHYSKDINNNFVALLIDENDPIHMLINKYAFIELSGNAEKHWIDKLKQFDNWRDICLTII